MSLFIGNIANSVVIADLEDVFEEYGPCRIKIQPNKSYGFVDYEQERDAEEALLNLKGKNVKGQEIRLEWSARSGKNKELSERSKERRYERNRHNSDRKNGGCYGCGSHSHKLRDCHKKRSSYKRSRSRSTDRYRRKSRSRSRSRSRDYNRRRHSRSRSRDRSRSRSNDRSRSRSNDKRRKRTRTRSSSYSSRK